MASVPKPAERYLALLELLRRFDELQADLEQAGLQVGGPLLTIQMSLTVGGRPVVDQRKKT